MSADIVLERMQALFALNLHAFTKDSRRCACWIVHNECVSIEYGQSGRERSLVT